MLCKFWAVTSHWVTLTTVCFWTFFLQKISFQNLTKAVSLQPNQSQMNSRIWKPCLKQLWLCELWFSIQRFSSNLLLKIICSFFQYMNMNSWSSSGRRPTSRSWPAPSLQRGPPKAGRRGPAAHEEDRSRRERESGPGTRESGPAKMQDECNPQDGLGAPPAGSR